MASHPITFATLCMVGMGLQIFAGTASFQLASQIAHRCRCPLGALTLHHFSDGEMRPTLEQDVKGQHVCVVQSTPAPADHLVELLLILDAAQRAGAGRLTALLPYAGYGRQDKMHTAGSALGAALHDRLIACTGAHLLIVCDPHTDLSIGNVRRCVASAFPVLAKYIEGLALPNLLFVAPDAGACLQAKRYANYFGVPWAACRKQRLTENRVQIQCQSKQVKNASAVLIDDMIDTGHTICAAAQCLTQQGARSVRACCTHLLLSGEARVRIENSALEEVVSTDTLCQNGLSQKYTVLTAAGVLAEMLQQVH